MEYEVGAVLEGKVTSITKFGAFVALEGGRSGLVHISEIANTYVNDVHDFLQEGQTVKVKLLAIKDGKLDLSIKKALPAPERQTAPRPAATRPAAQAHRPAAQAASTAPSGDTAFEDKLKQFLSSSERKMADLNRNISGKQGGRRRR